MINFFLKLLETFLFGRNWVLTIVVHLD